MGDPLWLHIERRPVASAVVEDITNNSLRRLYLMESISKNFSLNKAQASNAKLIRVYKPNEVAAKGVVEIIKDRQFAHVLTKCRDDRALVLQTLRRLASGNLTEYLPPLQKINPLASPPDLLTADLIPAGLSIMLAIRLTELGYHVDLKEHVTDSLAFDMWNRTRENGWISESSDAPAVASATRLVLSNLCGQYIMETWEDSLLLLKHVCSSISYGNIVITCTSPDSVKQIKMQLGIESVDHDEMCMSDMIEEDPFCIRIYVCTTGTLHRLPERCWDYLLLIGDGQLVTNRRFENLMRTESRRCHAILTRQPKNDPTRLSRLHCISGPVLFTATSGEQQLTDNWILENNVIPTTSVPKKQESLSQVTSDQNVGANDLPGNPKLQQLKSVAEMQMTTNSTGSNSDGMRSNEILFCLANIDGDIQRVQDSRYMCHPGRDLQWIRTVLRVAKSCVGQTIVYAQSLEQAYILKTILKCSLLIDEQSSDRLEEVSVRLGPKLNVSIPTKSARQQALSDMSTGKDGMAVLVPGTIIPFPFPLLKYVIRADAYLNGLLDESFLTSLKSMTTSGRKVQIIEILRLNSELNTTALDARIQHYRDAEILPS